MEKRCLYCYQLLENGEKDFHPGCSNKMFGKKVPPVLDYTEGQMLELGKKVIKSQSTVTGVQPKLSLNIEKIKPKDQPDRFTIVGLWGGYILKPPAAQFPELPELEDLTLHLAELAGIKTVPHSLIRLKSGNLAYITKRVDRNANGKIHMEDMCQLTERMTEHKYQGSYEQIGKAIVKYSENPLLDIVNFFEQVIFSFLTGNADMHLKNFSLIDQPGLGYTLCPAYDMVPSNLIMKDDPEELALNLNGKKRKFKKDDFIEAMRRFNIDPKSIENIFKKMNDSVSSWEDFIRISFSSQEMKHSYLELIRERIDRLG
ncbi:MAG: HipA domain-containing protein [Bacteroidales bacterium]|nr:HipA domain-containing protein [Bacteroidales bacterium]